MSPFAEYAPDQPPLGGVSRHVLNVLPKTKSSYAPVSDLVERGNSLSATCQGAGGFRSNVDGSAVNFAGDATKLWSWDGTAWSDVSRSTGGAYNTPTDGGWDFAQFNNAVIATNGIDDMQEWSIGSSANFARLGGASASTSAAPIARFIAPVRDFLFAGYLSTNIQGVRWSEQFNHASWVPGTNQSDSQDLPDNGAITGLVGGQYALIFQRNAITLGSYVGPDLIFQFDTVSLDKGCIAPGSIATVGQTTFFLDTDGFHRIDNGQAVTPIGAQRVDETFLADLNHSYIHRIRSIVDRRNRIYYCSYPSGASSDGSPDTTMAYNYGIDRWAKLSFGVDFFWNMYASLGLTLEQLDAIYPDLDLMEPSLDSEQFQSSPIQTLAAFKSNKVLAFFEGETLEAVIDTVEAETNPFGQAEIDRIIPYIDGGTISALLGRRNRLNDAMTFSAPSSQDAFGDIYFREPAARFNRARVTIAAGSTWTHAQGIEFPSNPAGDR